jgi:hypothetical protein
LGWRVKSNHDASSSCGSRQHEKFVASGLYRCYQDGHYAGLEEQWSIHEVGGAQFIRIDLDGRQADGRSELYEILRVP